MTEKQRELLTAYERADKRYARAQVREAEVRRQTKEFKAMEAARRAHAKAEAALAADCPHPEWMRLGFQWEHDTGYGRQSWRTGVRCTLCGAENQWPGCSGNWYRGDKLVSVNTR